MLIPKELLVHATELSLTEIRQALAEFGYTDTQDIYSADFAGQNEDGNYVYRIMFPDSDVDDEDDAYAVGNIYVSIEIPDATHKTFRFVADY